MVVKKFFVLYGVPVFWYKKWKFARMRIPLSLLLTDGNGTPVFGFVPLLRIQYCLACGTKGGSHVKNTTSVEIRE